MKVQRPGYYSSTGALLLHIVKSMRYVCPFH